MHTAQWQQRQQISWPVCVVREGAWEGEGRERLAGVCGCGCNANA